MALVISVSVAALQTVPEQMHGRPFGVPLTRGRRSYGCTGVLSGSDPADPPGYGDFGEHGNIHVGGCQQIWWPDGLSEPDAGGAFGIVSHRVMWSARICGLLHLSASPA